LIVTVFPVEGMNAQNNNADAAKETAVTFDFMTVTPLDEPPQPPPALLAEYPGQ